MKRNIIRSDHPSNSRRVGISIYCKQSLALKILDVKYLHECIVFQVLIRNKLCNFISLCQSPSQPTDIFDQFADNLELTLDEVANHNPFLIVVLGDFNAKSENRYKHDKTSYEGTKIDVLTTQFGLQKIIEEPIHVLVESFSCFDLIFTSHQNLVIESEVHSSLHPSFHHQITDAKFSLKIHYPQLYEREIWHYNQANVDRIRKAIDLFPWEKLLRNLNVQI